MMMMMMSRSTKLSCAMNLTWANRRMLLALVCTIAACTIALHPLANAKSTDEQLKPAGQGAQSYMGKIAHKVSNKTRNIVAGSSSRVQEAAKNWKPLIDFKEFRRLFNRRYESSVEEASRQRLYTARLVEVIKSTWRYLTLKSDTYNSINSRSDMTPEERQEARAKRPRKLVDEQLVTSGQIVVIEDPSEQRPEPTRGGSRHEAPMSVKPAANSWLSLLTGGGNGGRGSGGANSGSGNGSGSVTGYMVAGLHQEHDLRSTKCFLPPGDQGKCESCASFVAMAQMEYLHCRETSKLIKFSEQFPVDCGQPFGMMGCYGTDVNSLNQFISTVGLERADAYRYQGVKMRCPYYNKQRKRYIFEQAGELKLRHAGLVAAPRSSWSKYLDQKIPLHVGVLTNDQFEDYGGGVASSCAQSAGAHGMLLVGEGRERGVDYWLLRNSFGVAWGEQGYYKLSKRATQCLSDEARGYFQSAFIQTMGDSFVKNPGHLLPSVVK